MLTTATLRRALLTSLEMSGLCERVVPFQVADLGEALEALRDSPDSLAIIVPSRDTLSHEMAIEEDNLPARAEIRSEFELLLTTRDLRHGEDGAPDCVALKDAVLERLLWSNLGVPGLLCLPLATEPMVIERDNKRGREAWKLTLELRQHLLTT